MIGPGDLFVAQETDNDPPTVEVGAASLGCGPVEVTARVGGVTARRRFEADANGNVEFKKFSFDPCRGGEGSDLPDTAVEVTGRAGSVTVGGTLRLGPDTTKPTVKKIQSSPPPGSKVEKGDTIRFEVVGKEDLPGDTWQTGVQTLQVTGPRGLIDDKNAGRTPKACRNKSESLTIKDKYKVRRGDPAVIEICGIAEDYATNEGSTCAQYYKGEVWEGTFHQETLGCTGVDEWTLQVVVAKDDSVTGDGTLTSPGILCPGSALAPAGLRLQISGSRDRNAFHLTVVPCACPPFDLRVTGKTAEGRTTNALPPVGAMYEARLTCKSCEE